MGQKSPIMAIDCPGQRRFCFEKLFWVKILVHLVYNRLHISMFYFIVFYYLKLLVDFAVVVSPSSHRYRCLYIFLADQKLGVSFSNLIVST